MAITQYAPAVKTRAEFFNLFTEVGILCERGEEKMVFRLNLPEDITAKLWQFTHGHGPEDE